MVPAKRIYVLIINVFAMFSKRNRKHVLHISIELYIHLETLVKVWENSKKLWKCSPEACVPTAFLVLPNFHSFLYNSIETRYMFSILKCVHSMQDLCTNAESNVTFPMAVIYVHVCKTLCFLLYLRSLMNFHHCEKDIGLK